MLSKKKIVVGVILTAAFLAVGFFSVKAAARSELVKKVVRKIKSKIYYEATIHNPPGDNLPDWVDDVILGKIKGILK